MVFGPLKRCLLLLMNDFCASGELDSIEFVFRGLSHSDILGREAILKSVLDACARERLWDVAERCVQHMRQDGFISEINTYNTVTNFCASRGLGRAAETWFRAMEANEV